MNPAVTVTQKQLCDILLKVAVIRPVFIWGQRGIGKSALVQEFAARVGLPCVSLLGSQLAPEDLILGCRVGAVVRYSFPGHGEEAQLRSPQPQAIVHSRYPTPTLDTK